MLALKAKQFEAYFSVENLPVENLPVKKFNIRLSRQQLLNHVLSAK